MFWSESNRLRYSEEASFFASEFVCRHLLCLFGAYFLDKLVCRRSLDKRRAQASPSLSSKMLVASCAVHHSAFSALSFSPVRQHYNLLAYRTPCIPRSTHTCYNADYRKTGNPCNVRIRIFSPTILSRSPSLQLSRLSHSLHPTQHAHTLQRRLPQDRKSTQCPHTLETKMSQYLCNPTNLSHVTPSCEGTARWWVSPCAEMDPDSPNLLRGDADACHRATGPMLVHWR